MIKVTVFNEYVHEKTEEAVRKIYPNGMHAVIADFLQSDDITVRCVTLDDPECGLTQDVLAHETSCVYYTAKSYKTQ